MSFCITFLTHDLYKLLLDWDFPKENFSYWTFWLGRNLSDTFLTMDGFHNLNVVNPQTSEYWSMLSIWQFYSRTWVNFSQAYLFDCGTVYLRKFLWNIYFLTFCLSIYCLKAWFQVICNDWQNLFCRLYLPILVNYYAINIYLKDASVL